MRRFLTLLFIGLVAVCFATPAQASILGSHLTFDGTEDTLEDDSRAAFIDDGDTSFGVGDTIYGFISVSDTSSGNPSPDEIAILFAFDVTGTTVSQDGTTYFTHSAPAAGLASFVDAAFAPVVSITTPGLATTADATFVIVANTGTRDPLSSEIANGGDLKGFIPAEGWVYQATGGIDPGSADFLHLEASGGARAEFGGFTIFDHPFGSSVVFLPVTVDNFAEEDFVAPFSPTSTHDVAIDDATVTPKFLSPTAGGWTFVDSSNMRLNAVPEPASFAIWGSLAGLGLLLRKRRRIA